MIKRTTSVLAGLALALALFAAAPASHADEKNQATQFTFDRDVRIPGMILPAGTYWFQVLDSPSSKNIIQIFNFDRSELVTTVMTFSAERAEPHGKTILTLTDTEGRNAPPTMLTWFYPGRTIGHQFAYSTALQEELETEPTIVLAVDENGPTYIRVNGYREYRQEENPPQQYQEQEQYQDQDQEQYQDQQQYQPPQQYPGYQPQDQQPPDQPQPDQQPPDQPQQ